MWACHWFLADEHLPANVRVDPFPADTPTRRNSPRNSGRWDAGEIISIFLVIGSLDSRQTRGSCTFERVGLPSNEENSVLMAINPAPVSDKLGDPADWVDRYGDLLLRYASSRLSDRELAEDLVQETLLAAFRHRKQFDGKSAFSTWLVAILRRKIADHYRSIGKSVEILDSANLELGEQFSPKGKWLHPVLSWRASPAQLAENAEFWSVFQNCLGGLPGHLAQAFQLREVMQSPVDEVGRKLGITTQNLAVRLHRARLLLRSCLDNKWFS